MFSNVEYQGKSILLVEDQITTALIESKAIRSNGFNLVHVTTGEACLELIRSGEKFDFNGY